MPENLNPDTNFKIIDKRSPETQARKAEMPTGIKRKIYLASSWRNACQPAVVKGLRAVGHEVYDFQNPIPGNKGFAWSEIDPAWLEWDPARFVAVLDSSIARAGYRFDKAALDWCDTCVLLLPCGRSAHLEAGYAIGKGKPTLVVLAEERFEPELMYLLADVVVSDLGQMIPALERLPLRKHPTSMPSEVGTGIMMTLVKEYRGYLCKLMGDHKGTVKAEEYRKRRDRIDEALGKWNVHIHRMPESSPPEN